MPNDSSINGINIHRDDAVDSLVLVFDKTGQKPDKKLLFTLLSLLAFGWVMSFSASLGHFNSYSYFVKQTLYIVIGLSVGLFVLKTPLYFYKVHAKKIFILSVILLCLVFLPRPIGWEVNGSTRWINFVVFKFQPSELMKLAMILYMAKFLVDKQKNVRSPWLGLMQTLIIISFAAIPIMLETDLGATIIITATALGMLFSAGAYLMPFAYVAGFLLIAAGIFIYNDPVRWSRMTEFWQTELWLNDSERVHQTKQALIGIARGDWTGTGLGAGIQKYSKLPEPHTDMIFSIIGEELGVVGMLAILVLFAYVLVRGFDIAQQALRDGRKYSSYVAFGISTLMSLQISVNIAMNLALIPPKGFTLPLISYGGSSMIISMVAFAILLRIDMEARVDHDKRRQHYL